jgi:hypothetical protein
MSASASIGRCHRTRSRNVPRVHPAEFSAHKLHFSGCLISRHEPLDLMDALYQVSMYQTPEERREQSRIEDKQLIADAIAGKQDAYKRLMKKYHNAISHLIMRMIGNQGRRRRFHPGSLYQGFQFAGVLQRRIRIFDLAVQDRHEQLHRLPAQAQAAYLFDRSSDRLRG